MEQREGRCSVSSKVSQVTPQKQSCNTSFDERAGAVFMQLPNCKSYKDTLAQQQLEMWMPLVSSMFILHSLVQKSVLLCRWKPKPVEKWFLVKQIANNVTLKSDKNRSGALIDGAQNWDTEDEDFHLKHINILRSRVNLLICMFHFHKLQSSQKNDFSARLPGWIPKGPGAHWQPLCHLHTSNHMTVVAELAQWQ